MERGGLWLRGRSALKSTYRRLPIRSAATGCPLAATADIACLECPTAVVKVESVDLTGVTGMNRYRQCATNTIIRGDTQLDVELLLPGTPAPGPTLSGQVYTMGGAGRVPLARATCTINRSDSAQTRGQPLTKRDGSLCGIPSMPGRVYMVCGNDATAFEKAVDVRADTVLDVDATAWHQCLGVLSSRVASR